MKKIIFFTLIGFFLIAGCKKDHTICDTFTELTDHNHLIDISALSAAPELLDTLAKYPGLQVYKIINDQYTIGMHCNVFYQGIKIFTDNYSLYKRKNGNSIEGWDTIPMNINISFTPLIKIEQAIDIARRTLDYGSTCISYRLGISDLNAGTSFQPKNYKLMWRIQGENGLPWVELDANSGQVYRKDDGVRYIVLG